MNGGACALSKSGTDFSSNGRSLAWRPKEARYEFGVIMMVFGEIRLQTHAGFELSRIHDDRRQGLCEGESQIGRDL